MRAHKGGTDRRGRRGGWVSSGLAHEITPFRAPSLLTAPIMECEREGGWWAGTEHAFLVWVGHIYFVTQFIYWFSLTLLTSTRVKDHYREHSSIGEQIRS